MTSNEIRDNVPFQNASRDDLREDKKEPLLRSSSTNAGDRSPAADLSDVKSEIERLSGIVAQIANERAKQVATVVDDGMDSVRSAIRHNPWTSIGIASVVGFGIAIATTSRPVEASRMDRIRRTASRSIDRFDARSRLPSMQDVREYVPDLANTKSSLADRAEKLGNAIADIDPKTAVGPLIEAVRGISQAISRARG